MRNRSGNNLHKYLDRYAEAQALSHNVPTLSYAAALIVPFYDEPLTAFDRLNQFAADAGVLLIAVINAPDNAPADSHARTLALLEHARQTNSACILDCASVGNALPHRQGVGLARKIGSDLACRLWRDGHLASPWLYQTDADAHLPADYFDTGNTTGSGAVVFAHTHYSDDATLQFAARLYEWHMAYYHTSLRAAGSVYAYPTLGSTIAVHAEAYAAVRGYPKKDAAEDFYLLNKIQKVAGVQYVPDVTITLTARTSHRVPFGTGPALKEIVESLAGDAGGGSFLSYHPQAFILLKAALTYLERFALAADAQAPREVAAILDILGFARMQDLAHDKYPQLPQRRKALADWFDARRTLRFVHECRQFNPDQALLVTLPGLPEAQRKEIGFSLP